MKSVLISIQPKWCEKICNGEKTIEVRKSAPKEVPFKAYIYCTKDKPYLYRVDDDNNFELTNTLRPKTYEYVKDYNEQNGKVIGEFICDRIDRIEKRGINNNFDYCYLSLNEWGNDDIEIEIKDIQKSCISKSELNAYGENSSCLYGWHISDLKIYDKPKELSEFRISCNRKNLCYSCNRFTGKPWDICNNSITRPPQSWMFVEEVGE